MSRFFFLASLLLSLAAVSAAHAGEPQPPEMARFLASRKVLAVIHFGAGSATLGPEAKREIDRVVPSLKKLDPAKSLVRIEGFATPGGGDRINVPVSMSRARSVVDYIVDRAPLSVDLFLSGFRAAEGKAISDLAGCRAEIAVYDNIWQFDGMATEVVYKR